MAFQPKPANTMTWVLKDETGSVTSMSINVKAGSNSADVFLATPAMRAAIQSFTGCAVLSEHFTSVVVDNTPETPQANSRVERKGVFSFLSEFGKPVLIEIPGIANGMVNDDGSIDTANPAIQTFINLIVAADAVFCDSNGADITALSKAYERYNSTTKTQLPSKR
jgi:hypothetical protein